MIFSNHHPTLLLFWFSILLVVLFIDGPYDNQAYGDEKVVRIPFGAYNPELNTPAEVWYDPPVIPVQVGDTITWLNDDREGHTVTSGKGSGRFGWMSGQHVGEPDGLFESGRFLPDESWSYTFDEEGSFSYFCTIHPWMEGIIIVEPLIPNYPHDAFGNKIVQFPVIEYTADRLIEVDLTWEPNVIKTHEKVVFIYQTYDPATNSNLDKMSYDIIITQNGKEIFRDDGLTSIAGDYRNFIFEEAGPVEIWFENIVSWGTSAIESTARAQPIDISFRAVQFTTKVYENPDKLKTIDVIVQPKQTFQLYYEIAVAIIVVPAAMLGGIIFFMKWKKPLPQTSKKKSTPI